MRRNILVALIAMGAASVAVTAFTGSQSESRSVELSELSYNLQVRDTQYVLSGGGVYTVAVIGDDGVVLVGAKPTGWGAASLKALQLVTDRPVTTIINTSPDQAGSNGDFPDVVEIVAHENTKVNMGKMNVFKGENTKLLPNKTYTQTLSLNAGPPMSLPHTTGTVQFTSSMNRIDLYYFGAGHTNGDAIVVFPAVHAAYFGELFPGKSLPVIDRKNGGSGIEFPATLAKAVAEIKDVQTVIVGRETPTLAGRRAERLTWKDLQEYAEFNRDFLVAVQEAKKAGKSVDEAVAGLNLGAKYKGYDMQNARANVEAIYEELSSR